MEKILTAEDLALNYEIGNTKRISIEDAKEAMIEFARLHVEAALKEASELEETNGTEGYRIYPESILNSYPLDKIK